MPLAEGEVCEADGLVLALPLAEVPVPGALSLMAPPLPLVEAVVELLVLVPAGAVVVVVVVVVGADPLLAVVDPLVLELLLVLAELFDQSPCSFTEWPTCAERSCGLSSFANLPFFSCSIYAPPWETMQPFRVLPPVWSDSCFESLMVPEFEVWPEDMSLGEF